MYVYVDYSRSLFAEMNHVSVAHIHCFLYSQWPVIYSFSILPASFDICVVVDACRQTHINYLRHVRLNYLDSFSILHKQ